jgi:hypothetical protein
MNTYTIRLADSSEDEAEVKMKAPNGVECIKKYLKKNPECTKLNSDFILVRLPLGVQMRYRVHSTAHKLDIELVNR